MAQHSTLYYLGKLKQGRTLGKLLLNVRDSKREINTELEVQTGWLQRNWPHLPTTGSFPGLAESGLFSMVIHGQPQSDLCIGYVFSSSSWKLTHEHPQLSPGRPQLALQPPDFHSLHSPHFPAPGSGCPGQNCSLSVTSLGSVPSPHPKHRIDSKTGSQ